MSSPTKLSLTQVGPDLEREEEFKPLDWQLIRRMITLAKPYRRQSLTLASITTIRAIQIPLLSWVLAKVINGPIAHHDRRGIFLGALCFGSLAFLTEAMYRYRVKLALELGENLVRDLRLKIFQHLQRMPMSFFHRTKLGRLISRVTSDVEAVRGGIQDVCFVGVVQCGQMLGAAGFMLWCDRALFGIVVAIAPILFLLNRYFRTRLLNANRRAHESFSRITTTLAESVSGIRVTQGFVRQEVNAGLFRSLVMDHSRYNIEIARNSGLLIPLLELNNQFFIATLLLFGGYRAFNPAIAMAPDHLILFFLLAGNFFNPLQTIGDLYNRALTSMAGAERIFNLLDATPDWEDSPAAVALRLPVKGHVEFRNVGFGYIEKRRVLHDINFTAEPGQTVALVGHTGSGKSTITNLLGKFYLPVEGQILIDGQEIREIRGDTLHHQMGIVLQQNFLFSGTVLENIRMGRPGATDEEVVEAARRLNCLDMIGAMSQGMATHVGERGSGISLGQRQLVCFARAMLADPRIILLDEATSSVDAMTEARLQQALTVLLKGRTSFVVAHRLSTIRHADLVLVLDQGRIIERGTHIQLLKQRGKYTQFYRQFIQTGHPSQKGNIRNPKSEAPKQGE